MEDSFKTKVLSMTTKELVLAMINGITKQHVELDFGLFGYYKNEICFGCAATNTICEITGTTFTKDFISCNEDRAKFIETDKNFLKDFEIAIDYLRQGSIKRYNGMAKFMGISQINSSKVLPYLNNFNWKENLHYYEELAEIL